MKDYTDALKVDKEESDRYYKFSIHKKTEQQKLLEKIISDQDFKPVTIADIACGGGGASYHLAELFPNSIFSLIDFNENAVAMAKKTTNHMNATCEIGSIFELELKTDSYDLVVCWQTLSWIENPELAIKELIRICKPGGRVFASSLFNLNKDVDIYSEVKDYTRSSSTVGLSYTYNTYSSHTVQKWVRNLVSDIKIHNFEMPIDLDYLGKGIGTYTVTLANGTRLQLSAGMLLNWGILELKK